MPSLRIAPAFCITVAMRQTNRIRRESQLEIHEADRLVEDMRPVIVTAADTTNAELLIEEYYVFQRCPDMFRSYI
jgi:hypothetical protein